MKAIEDQIFQIVENVWTSFVGLPLERRSIQDLSDVEDYFLVASVTIGGAWNGEIALVCSEDLARRVAAHLFEIEHEGVTCEEIKESLGEIINIIGGNLKWLLPMPSHLSPPVVGYDQDLRVNITIPEHPFVPMVLANCDNWLLLVMLADHTQTKKLVIDEP